MQLTVRDVARYLSVDEETVYEWIDDGQIPFVRVAEQYRINRADLLEWATARKLPISVEVAEGAHGPTKLADALAAGGVHRVSGQGTREEMFSSVVEALNLPDPSDKQMVVELMLAREATGSTAVGKGIAIPHVRAPLVVHGASSLLQLCYLESPVDLGAKDGPVNTLFLMITPTPKAHLQLLSRLSAALHDPGFRNVVLARSPLEDVLREARRVEASFPSTDR